MIHELNLIKLRKEFKNMNNDLQSKVDLLIENKKLKKKIDTILDEVNRVTKKISSNMLLEHDHNPEKNIYIMKVIFSPPYTYLLYKHSIDDQKIFRVKAKCHNNDKFDKEIGFKITLKKAYIKFLENEFKAYIKFLKNEFSKY